MGIPPASAPTQPPPRGPSPPPGPHPSPGQSAAPARIPLDTAPAINNPMVVDSLTSTMAALADPTRRSILGRLADGPATVGELAAPFRLTQQAVSKHLSVLERAELVEKRREGRRHVCSLRAAPFREVADWMERYRPMWEERMDRLDDSLRALQEKEQDRDRNE